MAKKDFIYYLDPSLDASGGASSRLLDALASAQPRAPAPQWAKTIQALTQKGVKQAEIKDSGVLEWLGLDQNKDRKIDRAEVLSFVAQSLPKIKVVDLAKPCFANYVALDGDVYQERLYILSSESMMLDDAIEDLLYRIEELGFDPTPLIDDPLLVDRLEGEMKELRKRRVRPGTFPDITIATSSRNTGKNLMAHARFIIKDDLFFIQEMQSDWAQKGRARDWSGEYPPAPFVTNTELWSGVVLRDLLRYASKLDGIKRVAWTRAQMRNGFRADGYNDGLSDFYDNIVRRQVGKMIAKADQSVLEFPLKTKIGGGAEYSVMGFEMTDKARNVLRNKIALYSLGEIVSRDVNTVDGIDDEIDVHNAIAAEMGVMLGGVHMVKFYNRIYDIATGREVAGRYFKGGIEISMRAKDKLGVARHEALHFAYENFLLPGEKIALNMAFFPGSDLNARVREKLMEKGLHAAAKSATDPRSVLLTGSSFGAQENCHLSRRRRTF